MLHAVARVCSSYALLKRVKTMHFAEFTVPNHLLSSTINGHIGGAPSEN